MMPGQRRCSATTRRGGPCQRWATRDSDPPLCAAHAGRCAPGADPPEDEANASRGFYFPALLPEELDHTLRQSNLTLDEEISLARICLLRVAEALKANGKLTPEQRIRLAALIFKGASTVARLLRDRQAVSDEPGDTLSSAIGPAVDIAASELGVKP
ncbi:MAG: hypothetical protein EHM56_01960 [Chloroflexi bacterium]|nr:MAG: hypothetical protein EHM56_01960 [Chloroflexota bacterium]